jgi:hypothetical protein
MRRAAQDNRKMRKTLQNPRFFARKDRKFGGNCQAFNLDMKNAF